MIIRIKHCGMTRTEDVHSSLQSGVDFLGFIHYPKSRRYISVEEAAAIAPRSRDDVRNVAVCVNPEDALLAAICEQQAMNMLQLHGDESPERCAMIRQQTGLEIIKAIGIAAPEDVAQAQRFSLVCDYLLFDTKSPDYGGTGTSFDWDLLRSLSLSVPWFLSGGLNHQNIGAALRQTHAPMVDVCSGIEAAPGVKEQEKILAFNQAVRAYETQHPPQ